MSRKTLIIIFIAAFLSGLVAFLPLGWFLDEDALEEQGIGYVRVQGSVWDGVLEGLAINRQPIGDLEVSLSFANLLKGSLSVDWVLPNGFAFEGKGNITRSADGGFLIENTDLKANLANIAMPLTLAGTADIRIERLLMTPDGCVAADGQIAIDARPYLEVPVAVPPLAGAIRCEGDALLVPVSGQTGQERLSVQSRLYPDLRYVTAIEVETDRFDMQNTLLLLGFQPRGAIYSLEISGTLVSEGSGS